MTRHPKRPVTRAVMVAVLLATAVPARAQVPAALSAAPPAATDAAAAEQRIAALQAALQITAEQLPQWNSFAEAMRANAATTDALFRDRAANARLMSAADNMKSYAAVARIYADDVQKLSDAFVALYAILSDRQKELADAIFHQQSVPAPVRR